MKQAEFSKGRRNDEAVTLRDVALLAGVHPMTVSNALKGTGRVSKETIERVRRIAQELDYKPNLAARALVTGRTGTIAIALGPVSEHFYAKLLYLLERELTSHDYKMLFLRSSDHARDLSDALQSSAVDGVIAIDVFEGIRHLIQNSDRLRYPCVYAGVLGLDLAQELSVDHIVVDLIPAVEEALQFMMKAGRKRIAYLASSDVMAATTEVRTATYYATMKAAGRPAEVINLHMTIDTSHRPEFCQAIAAYFQEHGCPDALLCQNDEIAISTYRVLLNMGYRIPDDVIIAGCDGIQDMEYFEPPLSTISQPVEQMCQLTWKFLHQRLANPELPLQKVILPAELKVRRSLQVNAS